MSEIKNYRVDDDTNLIAGQYEEIVRKFKEEIFNLQCSLVSDLNETTNCCKYIELAGQLSLTRQLHDLLYDIIKSTSHNKTLYYKNPEQLTPTIEYMTIKSYLKTNNFVYDLIHFEDDYGTTLEVVDMVVHDQGKVACIDTSSYAINILDDSGNYEAHYKTSDEKAKIVEIYHYNKDTRNYELIAADPDYKPVVE